MHIKKNIFQIKREAIINPDLMVFSGDKKEEGKHLLHSFSLQGKREFIIFKKCHLIILYCYLAISSFLCSYIILNAATLTETV